MAFFEMHDQAGAVRRCYAEVQRWIDETGIAGLRHRMEEAETIFRRIGITFAVYGEGGDPERLIPFDLLPRVFSRLEWQRLDRGIRQRAQALNAFLLRCLPPGRDHARRADPRRTWSTRTRPSARR